jgi:RNA polymerase sigma-70 factor (ECF subfamily)
MHDEDPNQLGDRAAKLRPTLYRLALLQLRDPSAADDVVQETLPAAVEGGRSFEGRSSLKTWLISILRYKVLDAIRAQAKARRVDAGSSRPPVDELDETEFDGLFDERGCWAESKDIWSDPHAAMESQAFLRVLEACMERLPPRTSRAFLMREWLELDPDEICGELALTPGNLRVVLWRARMQLRHCLDLTWDRS